MYIRFSETGMTFIMMLVGLGMVLGNLLSGKTLRQIYSAAHRGESDYCLIIVLSHGALFFSEYIGIADFRVYLLRWSVCALLTLRSLLLQNAPGGELLEARRGGQIARLISVARLAHWCGGLMTLGFAYCHYVALPAAHIWFPP